MSVTWGWVGVLTTAITGGAAMGIMNFKVKTHDKIIFKEKGGLNVIDEATCRKTYKQFRNELSKVICEVLDKKFKEHAEQSNNEMILQELKKLNNNLEKVD